MQGTEGERGRRGESEEEEGQRGEIEGEQKEGEGESWRSSGPCINSEFTAGVILIVPKYRLGAVHHINLLQD